LQSENTLAGILVISKSLTSKIGGQDKSESDDDFITIGQAKKLTTSDLENFAKRFLEKNSHIKNFRNLREKDKAQKKNGKDDTHKKDDETYRDYLKRLMHKQIMSMNELIPEGANDAYKRFADFSGIKNVSLAADVNMKGLVAEYNKIGQLADKFRELNPLGSAWERIQEQTGSLGNFASILGEQQLAEYNQADQVAKQFEGLYPGKAFLDDIQTSLCPPELLEGLMEDNLSPALNLAGMGIGESVANLHAEMVGATWLDQLKSAGEIVSSFKPQGIAYESELMHLSSVSALAESTIMGLQWENIGSGIGIGAHDQIILQNQISDLAGSYSDLVTSIKPEIAVPSVVYEYPPFEFFHSTELINAITVRDDDTEESERREKIGNELYEKNGDSLCMLLEELDPDLIPMLLGARETLGSNNSDRARHFIVSLRELFTHVLHKLAPSTEIKNWSDNPEYYHKGRPTRRARLTYISMGIDHDPFSDFFQINMGTALKFFNLFQGGTHKIKVVYTERQLKCMLIRMEALLMFMLVTNQSRN
jgi:Predicted pPIWI-associating nuclease